jgi:hypothetical protein
MVQIWSGKTDYFEEIVDTFECAGIKCEVDRKKCIISVESNRYNEACGMLYELNQLMNAGW